MVRQWNPAACRNSAFGSVRSRADSQPWTSATPGPGCPPRAGMNQAGRSTSPERTVVASNGSPRSAGRDLRRVLARVPGSGAVGQREPVGETERRRGDGRREPGSTDESHGHRGRHGAPACQARAVRSGPQRAGTLAGVAKRDPHVVLGVERGAAPSQIKAAWRRLARSNHPDLTGDDPTAVQAATRRMAEINDAYTALTREAAADRRARDGERADFEDAPAPRRGGPPRPRPTRPVTRSLDMTGTFRQRNQATRQRRPGADGGRERPAPRRRPIQPPLRGERVRGEPPRASTPTGPLERGRLRDFRRPKPPTLDVAREHLMEFGKFHGHTLGQIAAFEPSYIDWVAGTVTRDPDLVAAARVIQADLDARGRVAPVAPGAGRARVAPPEHEDRPPISGGDRFVVRAVSDKCCRPCDLTGLMAEDRLLGS